MPEVQIENRTTRYDHYPDVCPICHHAIAPEFLLGTLSRNQDEPNIQLDMAFKCTKIDCGRMFIGSYYRVSNNNFYFYRAEPLEHKAPTLPHEVAKLSPSFKSINEQSHAAEDYKLTEIAGVGYRKALEFLIKDFCVYISPDKEEEIKNKLLGAVINDHVEDSNLKQCAKRAAWLGNDETHYVRKWEEKDISDLKVLIELTVNWVDSNLLTKKYLEDMPPNKN